MIGQPLPEALEIVLHFLMRRRRGDGMHLEASGIERPAEPADNAALSRRVPALQNDNCVLARPEISLLDRLQLGLQRLQLLLVFVEVHFGGNPSMDDSDGRFETRNLPPFMIAVTSKDLASS